MKNLIGSLKFLVKMKEGQVCVAKALLLALVFSLMASAGGTVSVSAKQGVESYACIPDGEYYILTIPGLAFDVAWASKEDNANLMIYDLHKGENQTVTVTNQPDGSIMLTFKYCNKAIDAENYIADGNGTNLQIYYPHGDICQRWRLKLNSDGTYTIFSCIGETELNTNTRTVSFGDYCMDVQNCTDSVSNSNLHLWTYHGEHNQRFFFVKAGVTMQQALDELYNKLGGLFFTVSGQECKSCKGKFVYGHACSNCLVSNIVKQDWFKVLFPELGEINVKHFPYIASGYKDSSYAYNGYSCFGFAVFAQYYVYSRVYGEQNFKGIHHYAKGKMTYSFLKNAGAKTGDVIRRDGTHSMILYSYDENGYTVIDCNGVNGKYNCMVSKRTLKYSSSKTCVISRPDI